MILWQLWRVVRALACGLYQGQLIPNLVPHSIVDNTMLQETVNRLDYLNIQHSITICNEEHIVFVAEQLREINKLEFNNFGARGKNTAPAIALAAFN